MTSSEVKQQPMTEKEIQNFVCRNWSHLLGLHMDLVKTEYNLSQGDDLGKRIDMVAISKIPGKLYLIELKNHPNDWLDATKILAYKALYIRMIWTVASTAAESISDRKDIVPVMMIPTPKQDNRQTVMDICSLLDIKYIFFDMDNDERSIEITDWSF